MRRPSAASATPLAETGPFGHAESDGLPLALVLDDDGTIRAMLADALASAFDVSTAKDLSTAIEMLEDKDYELIIADQVLPDGVGVTLLEASLVSHPHSIRVLITGSQDIRTAMDAVNRARVDRFFTKPIQFEEFRRQAEESVALRRAERSLRERIANLRKIESKSAPRSGRVLVVEDDESASEVFGAALEGEGFAVTVATNGSEALDRLGTGSFDLVVLDKNLPDISGLEVLQIARRIQPDIEAIVITGYASTDTAIQALESGAYDYLRKPLEDIAVLPRVVHRALERQTLARERQRLLVELLEANEALSTSNQDLRQAQKLLRAHMEEMDLFQDATVLGLARLAEYRDTDTGHHLERMRGYARILAEELAGQPGFESVDDDFVTAIYKAAPLHDIGKVGIPDSILLKPERLTPEEWRVMRTHPLIGGQTLEGAERQAGTEGPMGLLRLGKNIAFFHHERWDGGGYPFRKKGEEIPVEARIVAVADAYDAIISRRCYKPSFPHQTAMSILLEERDRQFDARVVDAFVRREEDVLRLKSCYLCDELDGE